MPIDINGDGFADLSFAMFMVENPGRYFLDNNRAGVISGTVITGMGTGGTWQFGRFRRRRAHRFLQGRSARRSKLFYYSQGDGSFNSSSALSGMNGNYMTRFSADFDGDGCGDIMTQGHNVSALIRFHLQSAAGDGRGAELGR